MKILLLENVQKVGSKGEIKDVKDGYALNFLLPHKKAVLATPETIKDAETKKAQMETQREEETKQAASNIAEVNGKAIEIKEKVNEKGHLFARVHREEITDAIKKQLKVELSTEMVQLEEAIKEAGEHEINIAAGDAKASVKLTITPEK